MSAKHPAKRTMTAGGKNPALTSESQGRESGPFHFPTQGVDQCLSRLIPSRRAGSCRSFTSRSIPRKRARRHRASSQFSSITNSTTGIAPPNVPIACGSVADANNLAGQGSPLARMFAAFFALNKSTPVLLLPVAEAGAGVAATGTVTVTAPPTQAGELALYIAGQKVSVAGRGRRHCGHRRSKHRRIHCRAT